MRLFVSALILSASFSALAAPVIDCRAYSVDEAIFASVDRDNGKSSITVQVINLNTDQVEKSETEPAYEMTEQLERSITSKNFWLDIVTAGRVFVNSDGVKVLASPGVLTRTFPNGRKQSFNVDCETVLSSSRSL
jgi:hypothetical protein